MWPRVKGSLFETLTVRMKISRIAGLFDKSDLSLTHTVSESWALASAERYLFPSPHSSLPPSLPPSLNNSAALQRTVWFCSAVGFEFLTVEVIPIDLCQWLAPWSVLEKFCVKIYLRWAFTPNVKSVLSEKSRWHPMLNG